MLHSDEETESYAIYSAVLWIKEPGYVLKNGKTLALERKFKSAVYAGRSRSADREHR
jgi:hypothetical protein